MAVDTSEARSAALRLRASQRHARAGGARDQSTLRVRDVAFDQSDRASALDNVGSCGQARVPDRAEEVDLQLERGERLLLLERAGVGKPHRGIGQVTQDAAVDGAHRIGVAFQVRFELEYGATRLDTEGTETDQLRDGWRGYTAFDNGA